MDKIREMLARIGDLTVAELVELATLTNAAVDDANKALTDVPTDEQLADLEAAIDATEAVTAEQEVREARATKAADLQGKVTERRDAAAKAEADAAEAKATAEADAAAVVAEAEAAAAKGADEKVVVPAAEVEVVPDDDGGTAAAEETRELVTAAGAPTLAEVAATRPKVRIETAINIHGPASLTAAAEVPGYAAGQDLDDMMGVTKAFMARMKQVGSPNGPVNRGGSMMEQAKGTRMPVARVNKPFSADLRVDSPSSVDEAMAAIAAASNEANLPGGSLIASGGWCAPSETMYDFCTLESTDGLWSLPEITASRGGITYPEDGGISFADIFGNPNSGFSFTEAGDIAGTYLDAAGGTQATKVCMDIPCPEFIECRLGGNGVCIRAGLLALRAYPELIRRVIDGAIVAHQHRLSLAYLADAVSKSTAIAIPAQNGATAHTLGAIELQVEDMRAKHRMSRSRTIEMVGPTWLRAVLRTDLAKRLGVELLSVTDAMIDAWFRLRGVSPQWVVWQDTFDGANSLGAVDGSGAVAWPTTVQLLMYPSGTFTLATSDVFEIDMLVDSTLLGTNDYIALFTESAWCMLKTCPESRAVTIPLCPSGATAGGEVFACTAL